MPGRNGGTLRVGGTNKGGTGRPPKLIRAGLREAIPVEVAKLTASVAKIEALIADFDALPRRRPAPLPEGEDTDSVSESRLEIERRESAIRSRMALEERLIAARAELVHYCGKYGLGTTITETDDEGNTPPGRLSDAERAAEVLRIVAERN